ncbi:MAG: dethiobiotin synthase [Kiritimatiellales bacterium]|nr:dethiobiotin synthase [Kiritimatiellales bacterium]
MSGLFITGTDTGIGKTALSALLLAELRRRGINAAPMKPAQTGCLEIDAGCSTLDQTSNIKHQTLSVPDLDYSLSMASMTVDSKTYKCMSPYTFEPACSPHLAAEMAGVEIEMAEIVIAARTLAAEYEFVIAEGAGGIMVPLNRRELMLDLMQALKFPIIVAARPGLGTINHTLLSIRALRSDGLNIAGVVMVDSEDTGSGFIEEDNVTAIEQFGKVPILGKIPYCAQMREKVVDYSSLPPTLVVEVEKIVNRLEL